MRYETPLVPAVLVRRYKRFLADVQFPDGSTVTAHTPNTGSMLGCSEPGSRVWLRDSADPKRKCRYSLELVESPEGALVGVNTGLANRLVREAALDGTIGELGGYGQVRPEVRYGVENSRIDLLLSGDGVEDCYVEVKNVTACENGVAFFPDAVSARGTKHLRELMGVVQDGHRGIICFCVQRDDARQVRPADEIDPVYGNTLREALAAGVEAIAYRARVSPEGIALERSLPVVAP